MKLQRDQCSSRHAGFRMQTGKLELQFSLDHDLHRDECLVLEGHTVTRMDVFDFLIVEGLRHPLMHKVSLSTQAVSVSDFVCDDPASTSVKTIVSQSSKSLELVELILLDFGFQHQLL